MKPILDQKNENKLTRKTTILLEIVRSRKNEEYGHKNRLERIKKLFNTFCLFHGKYVIFSHTYERIIKMTL